MKMGRRTILETFHIRDLSVTFIQEIIPFNILIRLGYGNGRPRSVEGEVTLKFGQRSMTFLDIKGNALRVMIALILMM
jgi:hypothetical protein